MSAQSKALEWLENDYNERNRGNDWRDLDRLATRYALAVLYFATDGGDSWNETYSFLSSSHECFWKKINGGDEPGGVLCDASFAVSGISMENNSLQGELPVELGVLPSLKVIHLQRNKLEGSLPGTLGSLTQLASLDLTGNSFSSSLPNMDQLSRLKVLRLGGNQLSGSLVTAITSLVVLTELNVRQNHFNGSWGYDDVRDNTKFPLLKILDISNCSFTGPIPDVFKIMANLQEFYFGDNFFSGAIMFQPPSAGGPGMRSLSVLSGSRNQLIGSFPWSDLSGVPLRHVEMTDNFLTSVLPNDGRFWPELEHIDFSYNHVQSTIPAALGDFLNLKRLLLSRNRLNGTLPSSLGNLAILETLDLSSNALEGKLPTELANCHDLAELALHDNHFTGLVPQELSELTSLRQASFQYNDLTGTLDFLCAVTVSSTSSSSSESGRDDTPISADCSGNIPKVGCTSCCQCHF